MKALVGLWYGVGVVVDLSGNARVVDDTAAEIFSCAKGPSL